MWSVFQVYFLRVYGEDILSLFSQVDIGEEDVVHLRIYRNLDQNVTLHGMQYPKGRDHPIVYF